MNLGERIVVVVEYVLVVIPLPLNLLLISFPFHLFGFGSKPRPENTRVFFQTCNASEIIGKIYVLLQKKPYACVTRTAVEFE